ncbi:hypothetical protein BAP_3912 [Bacillus sp. CN2]|nr:hypothetical protein BAP_3912 [Bacillus sp. CN2]
MFAFIFTRDNHYFIAFFHMHPDRTSLSKAFISLDNFWSQRNNFHEVVFT